MIEEDVSGNRLTLPSGDYKLVQKKHYEKKNEHVLEDWNVEYPVFIQKDILDKRRKVPSLWAFLKYRRLPCYEKRRKRKEIMSSNRNRSRGREGQIATDSMWYWLMFPLCPSCLLDL